MNSVISAPDKNHAPISIEDMSAAYFSDPELGEQFVIRMPDDTMSGTIEAGEQLLVKRYSGGNIWDAIYFYEINGRYSVKRFQLKDGVLTVVSDNKLYQNWVANPTVRERMNILGRVTARCQIHTL